jgi:hypothetical protein
MPASKVALQRTNANVHALAIEHENLVDVVVAGLDLPKNVADSLKGNANKIVIVTEQETHANVGIFNFDSFMGGVVSLLSKVEPFLKIAGSLIGGETGGVLITATLTALGAYIQHRRTVKTVVQEHEQKTEQIKTKHEEKVAGLKRHMEVIKRADPKIFEELARAEKKAKDDGAIT